MKGVIVYETGDEMFVQRYGYEKRYARKMRIQREDGKLIGPLIKYLPWEQASVNSARGIIQQIADEKGIEL